MIVPGSPDIKVLGHRQRGCRWLLFQVIHVLFQYLQDNRVIVHPIALGPSAGAGYSLGANLSSHVKYTQTGSIGLLRVLFVFHHPRYVQGYIFMYDSSLRYELLWCPVAYILMSRSQVLREGGIMIFTLVPGMSGYALVMKEDFDRGPAIEDTHFLPDILIRDAVVVPVSAQAGMSVFHDRNG